MKKLKKIIEKYYPIVISLVLTIAVFFWLSSIPVIREILRKLLSENCLAQIITIEVTLFGFLLAVLTIILQMENKMIEILKQYNRFDDLVCYAKSAIYSSFFIIFLAVIIIVIKDISLPFVTKSIIYYLFGCFFTYNILSTFRFVKIFFLLARSK